MEGLSSLELPRLVPKTTSITDAAQPNQFDGASYDPAPLLRPLLSSTSPLLLV